MSNNDIVAAVFFRNYDFNQVCIILAQYKVNLDILRDFIRECNCYAFKHNHDAKYCLEKS